MLPRYAQYTEKMKNLKISGVNDLAATMKLSAIPTA